MGNTTVNVQSKYSEVGLKVPNHLKGEMPDHIGFELDYLRYLCEEESKSFRDEKMGEATSLKEKQIKFLIEHVVKWVPSFTENALEYATSGFYKGILKLTKGYIMVDVAQNKTTLELIKELDLILDFNLRALLKGASEPYLCESILKMVLEYEIKIVPGDDSHSIATVGNFFDLGVAILKSHGFSTEWARPI